jgi:glycosidase
MVTPHWTHNAVFYHVYPLGFCGAPAVNDLMSTPTPRLEAIIGWLDPWRSLGINALYLGPVFESTAHGYDTADYRRVDRRLGDQALLTKLVSECKRRGMRVVLDGVFHHVGRDFWAFRDVLKRGASSPHAAWFSGLRFGERSPLGDPFRYDTWRDCYDLVKLNLDLPEVRAHLFGAVESWMRWFDIDGLRLDVADCIRPAFLRDLASFCRARRPDFWLMGEVVRGEYEHYLTPGMLDAVTNFELYETLHESLNGADLPRLAARLEQQYGAEGSFRSTPLYHFVDNHDVDRIASKLHRPSHVLTAYLLLFTLPGIPSIYYGSELGMEGHKRDGDEALRRPMPNRTDAPPRPDLPQRLQLLIRIRKGNEVLRRGSFEVVLEAAEQLAFCRRYRDDIAVVAVNASDHPKAMRLSLPGCDGRSWTDRLDGTRYTADKGVVHLPDVPPGWGRVLISEGSRKEGNRS